MALRLEEGVCQHTERINARKLEQYVMNTVMDKILTPDMVQSWLNDAWPIRRPRPRSRRWTRRSFG